MIRGNIVSSDGKYLNFMVHIAFQMQFIDFYVSYSAKKTLKYLFLDY